MQKSLCFFGLLIAGLAWSCGGGGSDAPAEAQLPPLPQAEIPGLPGHHNYPGDVLAEEVTILRETLEELYPGLYDMHSPARLAQRFDRMRKVASSKPELSYSQWLPQVVQLTTDLADQELTWGHSTNYQKWRNDTVKLAPIDLIHEGDRWFYRMQEDRGTEGALEEITAIQGRSPEAYLAANRTLFPIHGNATEVQAEWMEQAFPKHHTNFWERPTEYRLTLANGETRVIQGISGYEYDVLQDLTHQPPRVGFDSEESVGIFTLPSINYQHLESAGTPYEQAFQAVFATVQNRGCEQLVIDLRGTEGGHVKVALELLSYLTPKPVLDSLYKSPTIQIKHQVYAFSTKMMEPKFLVSMMRPAEQPDLKFDGKVVVLTDGDNRGATGLLVAALRKRDNTLIVGEQPPVFTWGIHHGQYFLEMPYSKIVLGIPSTRLIVDKRKAGTTELVHVDHILESNQLAQAIDLARGTNP